MPWGLLLLLIVGLALVIVLFTALMLWGSLHPPRVSAGTALGRGQPADPADVGLQATQWWLDRPGGVRLPVWEMEAETRSQGGTGARKGEGDSPMAVVIIHGWGMSRYDMLTRLEPWRRIADKIILYDLRGHGDSEGGGSRIGHGEERDLLELLSRIDSDRIIVAGLSMGGVIALHAMADAEPAVRRRVRGIVLYGVYAHVHESLRGRLRVQQLPTRPISDLMMTLLRSMGVRHRDLLESAGRIDCPLLLIHGRGDAISPVRHAEEIAAAAANATLEVMDEAGHLDMPFVARDRHDAIVQSFVAGVFSAAGAPGTAQDGPAKLDRATAAHAAIEY